MQMGLTPIIWTRHGNRTFDTQGEQQENRSIARKCTRVTDYLMII